MLGLPAPCIEQYWLQINQAPIEILVSPLFLLVGLLWLMQPSELRHRFDLRVGKPTEPYHFTVKPASATPPTSLSPPDKMQATPAGSVAFTILLPLTAAQKPRLHQRNKGHLHVDTGYKCGHFEVTLDLGSARNHLPSSQARNVPVWKAPPFG